MSLPPYIKPDIMTWLKTFRFKTTFRTRFSETDAYGHINNVSYFTYFEQARIDYFEHLQLFQQELQEKLNENMIVTANLECNYLSQLFYGQNIDIYVRTSKIGNSSINLEYAIIEEKSKALAAVGSGAIVYINRRTQKSETLPDELKEKIMDFESLVKEG